MESERGWSVVEQSPNTCGGQTPTYLPAATHGEALLIHSHVIALSVASVIDLSAFLLDAPMRPSILNALRIDSPEKSQRPISTFHSKSSIHSGQNDMSIGPGLQSLTEVWFDHLGELNFQLLVCLSNGRRVCQTLIKDLPQTLHWLFSDGRNNEKQKLSSTLFFLAPGTSTRPV